MIAAFSELHH